MSIGIFVGSDNGTTTDVCERLAGKLGGAELIDVANARQMPHSYRPLSAPADSWDQLASYLLS